jgi:phage shock protein PspC (stress-responsive transcriptional regulator)
MQKVIGINLNGNAYQIEERGYEALLAYLERADATLKDNPDKAEVIADLEQALAEKCQKFLSAHKTVVTAAEIDRIIAEMGPVDAGAAAANGAAKAEEKARAPEGDKDEEPKAQAAKRLYQIRDGAMISGVCNGLAAYFDVDVTLVRIAFVILAILTKGVWVLVYAVMMFVIPYANTSEEHAAAHGRPFTAKEVIDQAKRNYDDFRTNKEWRRHWRQQRRHMRMQLRQASMAGPVPEHLVYGAQVWSGVAAPLFGLLNLALVILLVLSFVSLATTHALFGHPLPEEIPLWAGFLLLILGFQVASGILAGLLRPATIGYGPANTAWIGQFFGTLWLLAIAASVWWGYNHVPAVHDFIQRLPAIWDEFVHSLPK